MALGDGGREGIRTLGLSVANAALSHLSYAPTSLVAVLTIALGRQRVDSLFPARSPAGYAGGAYVPTVFAGMYAPL